MRALCATCDWNFARIRRVSDRERLDRGKNGSPRSRAFGQADEPASVCAPPRRQVDTRHGRRLYRGIGRRRVAFHFWGQAIYTNGSRRWQDSFSLLVERHCKHRTAVAQGGCKRSARKSCRSALSAGRIFRSTRYRRRRRFGEPQCPSQLVDPICKKAQHRL